jgi:hypothetical protein
MAAIVGVGIAATAVITAFDLVSSAVKETAGAFAQAIGQIGGARNLQQMIVEAASNEKAGANARMTVNAEQRVSKQELGEWANKLASDPRYGGFKQEEWIKGAGAFGTATGMQKDLINNSSLTSTLGMMGHIGGVNPSQILSAYGAIFNQNRSLSQDQILSLMRSGIGMGREGQFNIQELATGGGRIMSLPGGMFGGDYINGMKSSLAYGAMIKGKTPGASLEEAGTEAFAFFREIKRHSAEAGQLGIKFNKNGDILNPDQAISKVVSNRKLAEQLIPGLTTGRESGIFVSHMGTGIEGVTDKSTPKEIEGALLKQIEHYKSLSLSQEDLIKENEDSITESDKLMAAFNSIAGAFEGPLLKILQDATPAIQGLVKSITDNKDDIAKTFLELINIGEQLTLSFAGLAILVAKVVSSMSGAAIAVAQRPYAADYNDRANRLGLNKATLAEELAIVEGGVNTAGVNKGKRLTPEELAMHTANAQRELEQIHEDEKKMEEDRQMIKSLNDIPTSLDKVVSLLGPMLVKLQNALDKNTSATENSNSPPAPTPPTRTEN